MYVCMYVEDNKYTRPESRNFHYCRKKYFSENCLQMDKRTNEQTDRRTGVWIPKSHPKIPIDNQTYVTVVYDSQFDKR